jgi:hypothetical protein
LLSASPFLAPVLVSPPSLAASIYGFAWVCQGLLGTRARHSDVGAISCHCLRRLPWSVGSSAHMSKERDFLQHSHFFVARGGVCVCVSVRVRACAPVCACVRACACACACACA